MTKKFYHLFFTLAGLLAVPFVVLAQCDSDAGTLTSNAQISPCQGAGFSAQASGDAVLDGDDALIFVVADSPGLPLGTVLATSADGQFDYSASLLNGTTYYVFVAAGNNDGSGGVDWADPCLSASPAAPLVYQATPAADAGPGAVLNCTVLTVQLAGSGSTGAQFSYEWSSPNGGNIVSGSTTLNPVVDQAGTYCLVVTDQTTGCTATDCVVVAEDVALPVVSIAPPQTLTCAITQVTLSANVPFGPQFIYEWSSQNGGIIVSGQTTPNPQVIQAGTYCITVTNTSNGCSQIVCVDISEDANMPIANAGPDQTLTCVMPVTTLDASSSTTGPGIIYTWTTTNGNIVSGFSTPTPVVNAPGTYQLMVTNANNGCTSTDVVVVNTDINVPLADAGPDIILNCFITAVNPQASASTGPNITYSWTGPGILNGAQTLNPVFSQPGQYCLVVTSTTSGCTNTACMNVLQDIVPPAVTVSATTMSCSNPQATLNASANPPNTTFSWSGPLGFSFDGPSALAIPGLETTYTVTVTNTVNGCTATATAQVQGDSTMPRVSAVLAPEQCDLNNASIALTPNPGSQQLQYLWSNGSTAATINNLSSGNYFVTISDTQSGCSKTVHYEVESQGLTLTSVVTPVLCFASNNGAITLQVSGGTGPYGFSWTGPGGFTSNTQNISNLNAGVYTVTATDVEGCTAQITRIVMQPADMTVLADIQYSCTGSNSIAIVATGGTPPYSYLWSNGSTQPTLTNLIPGPYSVTVSDANGCTQSSFWTIVVPPLLEIEATVTSTCFESTVFLEVVSGGPNVAYQWSDGSNLPLLTALLSGNYTVTATDLASGCTTVLNFDLTVAGQLCATVKGRVVNDLAQDCVVDAGDDGLEGWIVRAIGQDTFYAATNVDGEFTMGVLPGNYQLQVVLPNALWSTCAALPVSLASPDDTVTADLPVQSDILCPALTVDLSTSQLRRCFSNNYYFVNYCNEGPAPATNAYVVVNLDPFLGIVQASQPYTALGNNAYQFNIGTVASGACGSFWVQVLVSCSAVLGQTHCSEAHIYPDTLCLPDNPNWTGADVQVNALCTGDSIHFTIKNAGNGPMSTSLDYIVIEDGIMLMQTSGPGLGAGDSIVVSVPANGATWRVEADQEAFHPGLSMPSAAVEGCTVTGSFSTGYVGQFPNDDASPTLDIDCTANIGSIDPNDKQGFPFGYGAEHYIRPGTELEYLIRFQNTGTDTAFTVVLRDTLSPWLDPATVQPGASSHDYQFSLEGEGIVIFRFDNILLPDSFINAAASHGFVKFRIAQRADVPLETDILNQAAIYFDFNEPVLTNTTVHRVGVNFIVSGIFTPEQAPTSVRILPNPLVATAQVELNGWHAGERLSVQVLSSTGRLLREETAVAPDFTLDARAWPAGVYFLKVTAVTDGKTGTARFIVR